MSQNLHPLAVGPFELGMNAVQTRALEAEWQAVCGSLQDQQREAEQLSPSIGFVPNMLAGIEIDLTPQTDQMVAKAIVARLQLAGWGRVQIEGSHDYPKLGLKMLQTREDMGR